MLFDKDAYYVVVSELSYAPGMLCKSGPYTLEQAQEKAESTFRWGDACKIVDTRNNETICEFEV